jgi:hypothetical protein
MSSGTRNSIGDFLRSIFSTLVNKDDEVFKALFANPEETGAVETIFNEMERVRDEWCNNSDVYNQTGEMLEKTLSVFSVLSRVYGESDEELKERNLMLYARNGDTIWGDRWDIIRLFKSFFQSEFVYIVNDTDDKNNNLLADGDFEEQSGAWMLDSCGYSNDARLIGSLGVRFNNYGICSQIADADPDSTYFLHFFQNGNLDVEIKDGNGRYWKPADPWVDEFGSWIGTPHKIRITGNLGNWESRSVFFLTDQQISGVTISFMGIDGQEADLDYVRLFKKDAYSTFTLIVVLSGMSTWDTLGMAPGTGDPVGGNSETSIDYSKMSYVEQSHVLGVAVYKYESLYTELLEIVRAVGITSYIEILVR